MTQFKENLIFQLFKDKPLGCSKRFKENISKKFDNIDYTRVYRKIINYQIETYGSELRNNSGTTYIRAFRDKSGTRRNYKSIRNSLNNGTNRIIERNEV